MLFFSGRFYEVQSEERCWSILFYVNNSQTVRCYTLDTLTCSLVNDDTTTLEVLCNHICTVLRQTVVEFFRSLWRSCTDNLYVAAGLDGIERLLVRSCEKILSLLEGNEYQIFNTDSLCLGCRNFLDDFLDDFLDNLLGLSVKLVAEGVDLVVQITDVPDLEVVCAVRGLELVVDTYEETELCCLLSKLNSIARTVGEVPKNCWLNIKLPSSLFTKVVSECKTSLCSQLCIVTYVVSLDNVFVTESHPIADTSLCTNLETTLWIIITEQVCKVDSTIQTNINTTNDCVAISKT